MRCKGCDYPLWDIAARACPECGLPFRPSEYEFAANGVRFCCQHCGQAYYGTSASGHLVPPRFHCVSCARMIDMDEMLVLPREGVPETLSMPDRMPWLERSRLGFWRALFSTLGKSIGGPVRLADSIPTRAPDGSGGPTLGPAVSYAMLLTCTFVLLGVSLFAVPGVMGAVMGAGGKGTSLLIGAASWLVGTIIASSILLASWTVIAHATLRLTGGASGGFAGTASAVGYASGVNFISGIPCFGLFLAPVGLCWWAVVATIMGTRIHRISALRSSLAFIVVPGVLATALLGGSFALISGAIPASTTFSAPPPASTTPADGAPRSTFELADKVAGESLKYREREGAWPRTGLDLVRAEQMDATDFAAGQSASSHSAGGIRLDELAYMTTDQIKPLADGAANEADHPSGASRAGRVVFFTRGLGSASDLANVWIACVTSNNQGDQELFVIMGDGLVKALPADQAEIDAQNVVRTELGLPELPALADWP